MLRFRSKKPLSSSPSFLSLEAISSLLGVSVSFVRQVCVKAIAGNFEVTQIKDSKKTLDSNHIRFLTQHSTLKKWIGKSLDERASLFIAKFPDKTLTGGKLWHLYHKHGIKYKFVAAKKTPPKEKSNEIKSELKIAFRRLKEARK